MKILYITLINFLIIISLSAEEKNLTRIKTQNPHLSEMNIRLEADSKLLKNPAGMTIDGKGNIYIAQVEVKSLDLRQHSFLLLDDLKSKTVADRLAYIYKSEPYTKAIEKFYAPRYERSTVRKIIDSDNDGIFDKSFVFANKFDKITAGLGVDVFFHDNDVYFFNIPDVWKLTDKDGDHIADKKEVVHNGFGVRTGWHGHDMHGGVLGMDGRIYFSTGDRGYNVTNKEGKKVSDVWDAGRGAAFRMNADGTELEVFHRGLRNPQDLAFDKYGNLFTGDNSPDFGDRARFVEIIDGADTGWFQARQYIKKNRNVWVLEKMWIPKEADKISWITPPIDTPISGPSGLAYYPGLGLNNKYDNYFFLCDFRASYQSSFIKSFTIQPNGAGWKLLNNHDFIKNSAATDLDFGYNGRLYWIDFTQTWNGNGNGYLYSVTNKNHTLADKKAIAEMTLIFKQGFEKQKTDKLAQLLSHPDQRVRQHAHLELASRGEKSILFKTLSNKRLGILTRLHALWGLEVYARTKNQIAILKYIIPFLKDNSAHIRAQTAKLLGENNFSSAQKNIAKLLQDPTPRVQFFAALALGRIKGHKQLKKVISFINKMNPKDAYLRHSAVRAVTSAKGNLTAYSKDKNPLVRQIILLAYRQLGLDNMTDFLKDKDIEIVKSSARAINIWQKPNQLDHLAKSADYITEDNFPLWMRIADANLALGRKKDLQRLFKIANMPINIQSREFALSLIIDFQNPKPLEPVIGRYRKLEPRTNNFYQKVIAQNYQKILNNANDEMFNSIIKLIDQKLPSQHNKLINQLVSKIKNNKLNPQKLVWATKFITKYQPQKLASQVSSLLLSKNSTLHNIALEVEHLTDSKQAISKKSLLEDETTSLQTKQAYLKGLKVNKDKGADKIIFELFTKYKNNSLDKGLIFEFLEMVKVRNSSHPTLKKFWKQYQQDISSNFTLKYASAIKGGDYNEGANIFFNNSTAQCIRCHRHGRTGGDAGPDLSKISTRSKSDYILESIINPNAKVAKGFGSISTMPPMGLILTVQQVRDLTAFLSKKKF